MATDDPPSLACYLDEWLESRHGQIRATTARGYRQLIRHYLIPQLGDRRLADLDRRTIEAGYGRLLTAGGRAGQPLAPQTVRLCHNLLRRALEDARLDGLLDDNPAAAAHPPRHDPDIDEVADLQVWTAAQLARFLNFVDNHPWRAIWHLAARTGARRGEVLGLRWTDVDLHAAQIRIRRSLSVVDGVARLLSTKTSRARVVCLGPAAVEVLQRHRHQQATTRAQAAAWQDRWGLVFTTDHGHPIDPFAVTTAFRTLVHEAPVPAVRLHDLRHTHAALLLAAGTPAKVVSERLGHASITMTLDVYGHLLPGMDTEAATRFDQLLWPET